MSLTFTDVSIHFQNIGARFHVLKQKPWYTLTSVVLDFLYPEVLNLFLQRYISCTLVPAVTHSKYLKTKQENIKTLVTWCWGCENWLNTQEIKSLSVYTFFAGAETDCMKSQLCAVAFAVQIHGSCLRLVTGRKGLAVSLAGHLSRAKLVTCRRYEHKGCEEWERHADNKIQRGEIKWRNVTLLTESFPLGKGMDCDLFHGQWRRGITPFNPLWPSQESECELVIFFFLCLLGLGTGGAGEIEVEHGLGHP